MVLILVQVSHYEKWFSEMMIFLSSGLRACTEAVQNFSNTLTTV